jgi:hypothetical protein
MYMMSRQEAHVGGWFIRAPTAQTRRDQERVAARKRYNAPMFDSMGARLMGLGKPGLLQRARQFSDAHGVHPPDRLCERYREALICWFCENVPDFPEGFPGVEDRYPPSSGTMTVPSSANEDHGQAEHETIDIDIDTDPFDFSGELWDGSFFN